MKLFKVTVVTLMLSPVLAVAAVTDNGAEVTSSVQLPAFMTPAGSKFASQCTDEAFATTADPSALADQCERLLANWRSEASRRLHTRVGAPRPAHQNYRYSYSPDQQDMTAKPAFLSLRAVPFHSGR